MNIHEGKCKLNNLRTFVKKFNHLPAIYDNCRLVFLLRMYILWWPILQIIWT